MANTCSNCKHSCYVDKPGSDESVLVCVTGNSRFAYTIVKENSVKKCWEGIKDETNID